jgi:hypothetical protein
MKTCIATLKSISPYSQSRMLDPEEYPKKSKETPDEYEQRTWRHRAHVNAEGFIEIPGVIFAAATKQAAKRLMLRIPGKGTATYTKYFEAGIMCVDPLVLPVKAADVPGERLSMSPKGIPGQRGVWRTFPKIAQWSGDVTFFILDDIINAEIFKQVLVAAGSLVGIGRFRPEKRGWYGRFSVESMQWVDSEQAAAE